MHWSAVKFLFKSSYQIIFLIKGTISDSMCINGIHRCFSNHLAFSKDMKNPFWQQFHFKDQQTMCMLVENNCLCRKVNMNEGTTATQMAFGSYFEATCKLILFFWCFSTVIFCSICLACCVNNLLTSIFFSLFFCLQKIWIKEWQVFYLWT